jgi:taurine dioxygenase
MAVSESALTDRVTGLSIPPGITLTHLGATIGTEVHGLDLSDELSAEHVSFLRALWLERKVIFFRDQALSPAQHIRTGRYFGELEQMPPEAKSSMEGYPELLVFKRGANASQRENLWHTDLPYQDPPVDGAMAILRSGPDVGGDTLWADMCAAYDGLSDWLKRGIAGLEAEHRFDIGAAYNYAGMDPATLQDLMVRYPPRVHPVVQTHPETGRKILYVSLGFTSRILGVSRDDSEALLKLLAEQARVPEYQCRFRWAPNSIAFWDNRSVQHYACFDYVGQPRELHRVTLLGQKRWPARPATTS